MARFEVTDTTVGALDLDKLGRDGIRRIVEAGAAAAETRMAENTARAGHAPPGISGRATGEMLRAIGRNEYRESFGGGRIDVYPQGDDSRGVRNATKAFVLNYGRGRRKRGSGLGDRFITGDTKAEELVTAAMQAEADRLADETNRA